MTMPYCNFIVCLNRMGKATMLPYTLLNYSNFYFAILANDG